MTVVIMMTVVLLIYFEPVSITTGFLCFCTRSLTFATNPRLSLQCIYAVDMNKAATSLLFWSDDKDHNF